MTCRDPLPRAQTARPSRVLTPMSLARVTHAAPAAACAAPRARHAHALASRAAQAAAGIDTTQGRDYEQPAGGLFYIRSMYMILLPCLNVLQAVAILSFPIKGERLRALEVAQAKTFRPVARRHGK